MGRVSHPPPLPVPSGIDGVLSIPQHPKTGQGDRCHPSLAPGHAIPAQGGAAAAAGAVPSLIFM